MYNLLKVKTFLILFITTIHANDFKLCCPYAQQYNIKNDACSVFEPQNLIEEEVNGISAKDLNFINDSWCRNEDGLRMVEKINEQYSLGVNGGLSVPTKQEEIFKSNRFCLNIEDSDDASYTPILCTLEEMEEDSTTTTTTTTEYSTIKTTLPTTISADTTSTSTAKTTLPTTISADTTSTSTAKTTLSTTFSADTTSTFTAKRTLPTIISVDTTSTSTAKTTLPTTISVSTTSTEDVICNCNTEPPKFPDIFCENIYLFEKCIKCIVEKTCEECTTSTFKTRIEFVDILKDKNNKHAVQVNKKECPYWQYTYNLIKENNTVHLSILNQTCDKFSKATLIAGTLFYVGIGFLIFVVLVLLGIIIYCIKDKRKNAREYAAFVQQLNTKETELHPMFRPNTAIYSLPDNINFN